ncbi:hypothetical protein [Marinitoga sp. 38H-ov]|uniref:hypothetical protein n=1 Tax=Marinitoga sp. 38H-ov TaxID=1755814 RepID=UPI0013EB9786|nr:hypothetical protein [Marinitoga sp. 38H-ov]KAF2956733.1 hypothetical protein AS160_03990 [Marinitoga sp. 38H-ov]
MIYRYILSIMLLILSIILFYNNDDNNYNLLNIPNYVISDLPETIIKDNIKVDEINEILSKIKNEKGVLIQEFRVYSNNNFDNNKTYSIYIKRQIPQNIEKLKNYEKLKYNTFGFIEIDLDKVWENSNYVIQTDLFTFSGIIIRENEKKAYVYFKDELLELSEKMKIGDYIILKIYNNGVLLYNEYMKRFEVLK